MIKNIIFDWSGVINDNREISYLVVLEIFKKLNIPPITMEQFRNDWEQPYMLFYNKFIPYLDMNEEVRLYKEAYAKVIKDNEPKARVGMVPLLKKLKAGGIRLIIISSDHPEYLHKEIANFGLDNIFDEINSDVHDKSKDIAETVRRNNFIPNETIFIGDTQHEIDSGKSVHLLTGAVTWGIHNRKRLTAAKPDYIFDTPDELEQIIFGHP